MDKKSRFLIIIFVIVIFVSIFFTYKRSFLDRDFIIESEEPIEEVEEEIVTEEDLEFLEEPAESI